MNQDANVAHQCEQVGIAERSVREERAPHQRCGGKEVSEKRRGGEEAGEENMQK